MTNLELNNHNKKIYEVVIDIRKVRKILVDTWNSLPDKEKVDQHYTFIKKYCDLNKLEIKIVNELRSF